MYISGGQNDIGRGQFEKDVWKFDAFKRTWSVVTQMEIPRRNHGTCSSETELFVLGGFGKYRVLLDSFQKYDTVTGTSDTVTGRRNDKKEINS